MIPGVNIFSVRNHAFFLFALLLLSALCFPPKCFAAAPTNTGKYATDIAVIDRALATAQPGDSTVRFGDCGMRISDLQTFRARLVAMESPAQGGIAPAFATPTTVFKWPGGVVYYRFDPTQVSGGTITALKMQQFRDGVGEWAGAANLQFVEFTGATPTNFITVQEMAGGEGGFSSSVGVLGGEQFLQFGPTSWNRGTICHEMGHALGLYHEQQRDDRDTYVVIDFDNIASSQQANFTLLPNGTTEVGPYDFYSVMEYSRNALAIDPTKDTISMQPAYAQFADIIGKVYDRTLSKLDRAGMASIYGNPPTLPSAIVTNTKDSGPGTLRAAIYYAFDRSTNSPPTTTSISFQIPKTDPNYSSTTGVFTITPTFAMPAPGDGTTIDGTTQTTFTGDTNPKGPEIMINGSLMAGFEAIGSGFQPAFILRQANCTVKGLAIGGFDVQAIQIIGNSALGGTGTGNSVSGCYIGTDATGATSVPNAFPGIEVYGGAHSNTIGGTTAGASNVISGNTGLGIYMHDAGTTGNLVIGNFIGVNAAGTAALPNLGGGIQIAEGAQANTIGGTTVAARNVISGNSYQGIAIAEAGTNANVILGNYIGLNAAGTAALGNGLQSSANNSYFPGIGIYGGAENTIVGGIVAGSANVISGNLGGGITISDTGTTGNIVEGNLIGTNPGGTAAIANGMANPSAFYLFGGVEIFSGAQSNIIGGTTAAARNIISGNGSQGVYIGNVGTTLNMIEGNFIGTDITGSTAIANGYSGVGIFNSASSNTVGGTAAGTLNLISGNTEQGVAIGGPDGGQSVGPTLNIVEGNYIGVNLAGNSALANGSAGVDLFNASQNNTVGGTTTAARNIISGNAYEDVVFSDQNTSLNTVEGNYIGLDKTGATAITNSNSGVGIYGSATNNTIGGVTAGARNYISGHSQYGVFIENSGTNGNMIEGNTIGLNVSGTAVANGSQGVAVFDAAQSNIIGGTVAGAGNIIAGNTDVGIGLYNYTTPVSTLQDSIYGNSIFGNSSGIYLYNGANNSQAPPALSTAVSNAADNPGGTDVNGTLTSTASKPFRVEFFSSPAGGSQGQTYLGFINTTTNSAGMATFAALLTTGVTSGNVITAIAIDSNGNSSSFSAAVSVTAGTGGGPQSQTITFPGIASQTYGAGPITLNATATSGLAVSYSVTSGSATIAGNSLTVTGAGSVTVQATQAGNASFSAATPISQSFIVNKAANMIAFPTIADQPVGTTIALNATASSGLAVTYTVSSGPATLTGTSVKIYAAGAITLRASQAGNANYVAATNVVVGFNGIKDAQTITFPSAAAQAVGGKLTLTATSTSGLAVAYTLVSGPATLSGAVLTFTATGTVIVTANQAGNGTYAAAPAVSQMFTVGSGGTAQTITFPAIANQTYGVAPITLGATASSGMAVTYTVTGGPASVSGSTLTITGAGSVTVQANQAGDGTFAAAPAVTQSFTVAKASQTITFSSIPNQAAGGPPITLNATSSSGLAVTFSIVTGPASISGNTLTTSGAGTVTVQANQSGSINYAAAASVSQMFTVSATGGAQSITFPAIPAQTFGSTVTLNATASSGLAVSYSVTSGSATVSGNVVTLTGLGSVTIQATQVGNGSFSAATPVSQSFAVSKGANTITFPAIADQVVGTTIVLNATASSGLPVTYAVSSGPATLTGNSAKIYGTGAITIRASQAGNADYVAAANVINGFNGIKTPQTITFTGAGAQTAGGTLTLTATASSGLAVTYTLVTGPATLSGKVLTFTGNGTVTVAANQAGNATYAAAPAVNQIFTVGASGTAQTITFPAISNQTYGVAPITLGATASSGLPVAYSITTGSASVSGNMLTITGAGSVTVQANQAGNFTYTAAPAVSQSFTVAKAAQTIMFSSIPNQAVGGAPITLSATSTSGLAVTFSIVSGPATISGATLTTTGAGTVTVQANQAGNANETAAAPVNQTFTVSASAGPQTITFPAIPAQTFGNTVTLNATASSGLAINYSVTAGSATISGNTVTLTGLGSVTIQATQAGNASFSAATPVSQSFNVSKGANTITFPAIADQAVGTTIVLNATASSGLPITYAVASGPATLSGNTAKIYGTGAISLRASQAGNSDYVAATNVVVKFNGIKAN